MAYLKKFNNIRYIYTYRNIQNRYIYTFPSMSKPNSRMQEYVDIIPEMTCEELTVFARKCVKQGFHDVSSWKSVSNHAVKLSDEFTFTQTALLLSAFADASLQDLNLFSHMLAPINRSLKEGSISPPRDSIIQMIMACGRLQIADEDLVDMLLIRLNPVIEECRPKDIANLCHALSKMHIPNKDFFSVAAKVLQTKLHEVSPMAVANICTAFAGVYMYDANLFDAICADVKGRGNIYGTTELLNLLVGLSYVDSNLFGKYERDDLSTINHILECMKSRMGVYSLENHITIFESLLRLNFIPHEFMQRKLIPSLASKRHHVHITAANKQRKFENAERILRCSSSLTLLKSSQKLSRLNLLCV
eukprot:GHVL01031461.1.p1 GENE.GHVL01031461.1~~GHVL01031461.1.p1  ORF type:complete len:361 (-),score=44.76 GHVL01031461.1:345-1427(-)